MMTRPATTSCEAPPFLGSEREAMRARHHNYAQAVAQGQPFPGPASIEAIMLGDPTFQDLVSVYRERL